MRFPRVGASECDLMHNLSARTRQCADSQVFWSNGCFTNMLDHGAEHIKLCQLDMPRNFFSGTNCVAESGQFPSNFPAGRIHSGQRYSVPAPDAVARTASPSPSRATRRCSLPATKFDKETSALRYVRASRFFWLASSSMTCSA